MYLLIYMGGYFRDDWMDLIPNLIPFNELSVLNITQKVTNRSLWLIQMNQCHKDWKVWINWNTQRVRLFVSIWKRTQSKVWLSGLTAIGFHLEIPLKRVIVTLIPISTGVLRSYFHYKCWLKCCNISKNWIQVLCFTSFMIISKPDFRKKYNENSKQSAHDVLQLRILSLKLATCPWTMSV